MLAVVEAASSMLRAAFKESTEQRCGSLPLFGIAPTGYPFESLYTALFLSYDQQCLLSASLSVSCSKSILGFTFFTD